MALQGTTNEQKIWSYFKTQGFTDEGVSGIMGNLYAESALNPTNLQNAYEKKLGYSDASYTSAVDKGTYRNFVRDSAGYGLAQWTYWSRKQALYDFAKSRGVSIGDLEMQLDFLMDEMKRMFSSVLSVLRTATSVREASDIVLLKYEIPLDCSETMKQKRAQYGQRYYDKFAKKESVKEPVREPIKETVKPEIEKDNTPDSWAEEAVTWAVKKKILFGDEHGNYKLHDDCTRQEMLIFLNRLYNLVK